jgi:putative ABC transport system permease protein
MTFGDALGMAAGNLRRLKLRAGLTVAGVVIAVGAMVAMVSFGAGNHRLIAEQAERLGLLNTVQVTPSAAEDSLQAPPLDAAAVARLAALPGVRLAYPLDALTLSVERGGKAFPLEAQALTPAALETKLFSQLRAGERLRGLPGEVLVTDECLEALGLPLNEAAALVGDTLYVSLAVASLDSGLARALAPGEAGLLGLATRIDPDSLRDAGARQRLVRRELGEAAGRFLGGYLGGRVLRDTLVVRGIIEEPHAGRLHVKPLILRPEDAQALSAAGPPADPVALISSLQDGSLFAERPAAAGSYSQVTLDLEPMASYPALRDSLRAQGYRVFSFAEQLDEIRRAFVLFDLGLAAIGLVALATAALGIVNTLLMAISERRREIGVLKALGADEREIRGLFLAESALMGLAGGIGGVLLGWLVARAASIVAKLVMVKQGLPAMELFATPWWLIGGALAFGLLVSLVAGLLPAARAARVDPVEALRGD